MLLIRGLHPEYHWNYVTSEMKQPLKGSIHSVFGRRTKETFQGLKEGKEFEQQHWAYLPQAPWSESSITFLKLDWGIICI